MVVRLAVLRLCLDDENATAALGVRLARAIEPGLKIYLSGELGSGKTTLVRGVLRALGYRGKVKSPTFTLVELYEISSLYLYHFDFYRLNRPEEWEGTGFREYFREHCIWLVEWPERAGAYLPVADLSVRLEIAGAGRHVEITAATATGRRCLERLQAQSGDSAGTP